VDEPTEEKSFLRAVFDDRIVTVPNLLSVGRLVCIPLFLYLLLGLDQQAWAALLLAVLGATDYLDGQIARRFDQVSELGKLLDPAADRLLLIAVVIGTAIDGAVPLWFAVPVMIREPTMFIAAVVLGLLGAKRIDVTWYGKLGTAGLMVAFPLLLYGASTAPLADLSRVVGWAAGIPGLALSYWAAILYIPVARRALSEGRSRALPAPESG
jgi:cardiolipin synthase (CMP-forming)